MKLPINFINQINNIHNSHCSNEMKNYKIEQLINFEENEELQNNIKEYWIMLTTPKAKIVKSEKKADWNHPNLQFDKKGNIMTNNPTNLFTILMDHPKFKNRLSFNELTHQYCYDKQEIHDLDYTRLRTDICNELRLVFSKSDIIDTAELVAKNNPFHPIKDYLKGLSWDGIDRIPQFVSAMRIENSKLNESVMISWLIASVARIMKPGCKVDSIPVFQGSTGNRKSTAIKALMPNEEWFSDEPVDFGTKDSKQMLLGKWFVELAELSSFKKKDNNLIKSNITQTIDEFRSPYDRKPKKYPRQFIYIGTTNDLEFLTDPTSNRRFWILQNEGLIDIDAIVKMRDQLWAQAVNEFSNGKSWWLSREEEKEMSDIACHFESKDAWHEKVEEFIKNKEFVTTIEVLEFIKINMSSADNTDRNRIVKILQFLKWTNTVSRINGELIRGWKKIGISQGKSLPEGFEIAEEYK